MNNIRELYKFTWQERDGGSNRVFVQGPSDSCPIGCAYCYIGGNGVEPEPYDEARLNDTLDAIVEHPDFSGHTMVSLGCDTDPLLPQLVAGTIQVINRFAKGPNPIQLATKLVIPPELIELSKDWPFGKRPPVLSTSITTLKFADKLEPFAPAPEDRVRNFDLLSQIGWNSIALMKPMLASTKSELGAFVELYTRHTPDGIVVGSMYRHGIGDGTLPVHPVAKDWSLRPQEEYKKEIIDYLQAALPHTFVVDSSVDATIRLIQG